MTFVLAGSLEFSGVIQPNDANFFAYENAEMAAKAVKEDSKNFMSLNGTWKFYFVDSYKKLPENITDPNTNTDSWDDIQVPGNC